jgi:hypothetical protein
MEMKITINKILSLLLLVAVLPMPYDYYQILRVVVSVGVIYLLAKNWAALDSLTRGAFIVIAIVFNPVAPIYLSKGTWTILDLMAAGYLFFYDRLSISIKKNGENKND